MARFYRKIRYLSSTFLVMSCALCSFSSSWSFSLILDFNLSTIFCHFLLSSHLATASGVDPWDYITLKNEIRSYFLEIEISAKCTVINMKKSKNEIFVLSWNTTKPFNNTLSSVQFDSVTHGIVQLKHWFWLFRKMSTFSLWDTKLSLQCKNNYLRLLLGGHLFIRFFWLVFGAFNLFLQQPVLPT